MSMQNILIGLCGCAGAIGLIVLHIVHPEVPALDEHLCEVGKSPPYHIVWFLDPSDPFSPGELRTVQNDIRHRTAALQVGERVSIVALAPQSVDQPLVRPLFSKCRPRDGSQANPWFENPRLLADQYREQFADPLEEAVAAISRLTPAETSPLLEALWQIARMPSFDATVARRSLILVSDLLQHSPVLSHYHGAYRFGQVRHRVYITDASLQQCDIEVFLRDTAQARPYHTPQHAQFWADYMDAVDVHSYVVKRF